MSAPIFRDPVYDGATDPTVIRNQTTGEWWMFYTQRRTTDPDTSVRWVHGTAIGIAVSSDNGSSWTYRGTARGLESGATLWAPEVIAVGGHYRMYATVVDGVPDSWVGADAHIVEYRSDDLIDWRRIRQLDLGSDRVIDAAVARCADGRWRLWYKNESDGSSTWSASSTDLETWVVEGVALPAEPPHEGPNVFELGGWFWLVVDEWRGLGVFRSSDGIDWRRQESDHGLLLDSPGAHPEDRAIGHHADAVVVGEGDESSWAVLFYFTHPRGDDLDAAVVETRRSPVHIAQLSVVDGRLVANRDISLHEPLLWAPFA
ncbi:glycoside hydrolase [Microbacterium sp. X-17]|uniref:glycoside hydrolase n=1 Tax=Microbacterium sp. X-17 TaxID=3144404 RepID=UPI0031F4F182